MTRAGDSSLQYCVPPMPPGILSDVGPSTREVTTRHVVACDDNAVLTGWHFNGDGCSPETPPGVTSAETVSGDQKDARLSLKLALRAASVTSVAP